jgi:hypothetical protein
MDSCNNTIRERNELAFLAMKPATRSRLLTDFPGTARRGMVNPLTAGIRADNSADYASIFAFPIPADQWH